MLSALSAAHGVGAVGGTAEDQTGDLPDGGDAVVVVEVAAETFLVGQASDSHHHRVADLSLAEEAL